MARKIIARKGSPDWTIHPGEILREEFLSHCECRFTSWPSACVFLLLD